MKYIYLTFFFFISQQFFCQNLPLSRSVDWSSSGNTTGLSLSSNFINFVSIGGNNSGNVANDGILDTILANISNQGAIIYFPNGNYLFNEKIILKSNIQIIGESSDNTIFTFNLTNPTDAIEINGNITSIQTLVSSDLFKDNTSVFVTDASSFQVGDYIKIIDNDVTKITSSWAIESTGQIIKIIAINGNEIQISNAIRRNYLLTDTPKIIKLNMISNVGIERITIQRQDATVNQTSNISLNYVINSNINCIKSYNCNFSHIVINNSANIEVVGSYFKDAFAYGDGGQGYGVVLQYNTGKCLINNNIFNHLRHSMLLQAGANGNVLSYNYSINPYWTGTSLPSNSAGDIVLHGNYVYCNLIEGNIIQNIVIDNSHGINGPYNTFFRNRAELYGIFMNSSPSSDSQNFIANEVTNTGFLLGNYSLSGTDHFQYGNIVRGVLTPSGTDGTVINSLYLNNIPPYFNTHSFWPPIGIMANYNANIIESKSNYNSSIFTQCPSEFSLSYNDLLNDNQINLYPNPTSKNIYISNIDNNNINEITIYSLLGNIIMKGSSFPVNLDAVNNGNYLIVVQLKDGKIIKKIFIKK